MSRYRLVILLLISFIMAEDALAYRPFGTEDAGVAGKGVAQSEISWDYLKWDNNDLKQESNFWLVPIYGLTDNLEFSVEVPYIIHDHASGGGSEEGIGDINLAVKYLLLNESDNIPAFTLKGVVKMDNGDYDKGLGSGDKDYSLFAVASKSFGMVTIHGHFGYAWIGKKNDQNLRDITLYGLALDCAVTEPVHIVTELNGNRHPDQSTDKEDPRNVLAGFTYKVSEKITLDAAYKWGLTDSLPKGSTTVGASITY